MTHQTGNLEGLLMGKGRFRVGKFVAGGAFGAFHLGVDLKASNRPVAVKCEKKSITLPQLHIEFQNYKVLNAGNNVPRFIPKVLYFDQLNEEYDALVLELFGPSLKKMQDLCGGKLSITTTTQLLMQLITIMEYVHDRKILYRDIKPDNFLLGRPKSSRWCTVILIDLGFAKSYVDDNNKHIPYVEGKALAGTLRYASVNNHLGREICRRDDLEAILYMAVWFFKRDLPWESVATEETNQARREHLRALHKEAIDPEELCSSMPRQYAQYLRMVRPDRIDFEERPPYRRLIGMMRDVLTVLGFTFEENFYDWDVNHQPIGEHLRM